MNWISRLVIINKYFCWMMVILISIILLGQLIHGGCINISALKVIIIYIGCAVIIGLSER